MPDTLPSTPGFLLLGVSAPLWQRLARRPSLAAATRTLGAVEADRGYWAARLAQLNAKVRAANQRMGAFVIVVGVRCTRWRREVPAIDLSIAAGLLATVALSAAAPATPARAPTAYVREIATIGVAVGGNARQVEPPHRSTESKRLPPAGAVEPPTITPILSAAASAVNVDAGLDTEDMGPLACVNDTLAGSHCVDVPPVSQISAVRK